MAATPADLRPEVQQIHREVKEFIYERVIPMEKELRAHSEAETWTPHPEIERLKEEARSRGLWNLFLPPEHDGFYGQGRGLSNLEYAHVAELTGHCVFSPGVVTQLNLILNITSPWCTEYTHYGF